MAIFLLAFAPQTLLYAQNAKGKDCNSPIILENKSSISESVDKIDRGQVNDLAGENSPSCLVKGEKYPFWYQFTASKNSSLSFNIEGTDGTNWDWVIYELTDNCENKIELACNGALNMICSNTGASTTRKNSYNPQVCDESNPFNDDINLNKGSTYILFLNCTDCRQGDSFNLTFDGRGRF
ncbi:hypothetical protein RCC89_17420 [Cytophagaceae bacterium ABcell3]|nr:hypothetical protein RCC89_17420 [Cytophagaceae bacterium ABcell3]